MLAQVPDHIAAGCPRSWLISPIRGWLLSPVRLVDDNHFLRCAQGLQAAASSSLQQHHQQQQAGQRQGAGRQAAVVGLCGAPNVELYPLGCELVMGAQVRAWGMPGVHNRPGASSSRACSQVRAELFTEAQVRHRGAAAAP